MTTPVRRATLLRHVNPVTRLAAAIVLSLPLLTTLDWVSATVAVCLVLVAALALGHRPSTIARSVWPLLLVAPIATVSMALYGRPAGTEYLHWGLIHITHGSLLLAAAVFARVLALGIPAILLFRDVDPTDMADGLAQVARLPARFVLGTLAGIRLMSALSTDWHTMALARRARGLGDTGAVRRFLTMAFALLVVAIRRGSTLATAMEARGFGGPTQRTWARESHVGWPDAWLLVGCVAIMAVALSTAVFVGTFNFVGS